MTTTEDLAILATAVALADERGLTFATRLAYSDDQARDTSGKFGEGGASSSGGGFAPPGSALAPLQSGQAVGTWAVAGPGGSSIALTCDAAQQLPKKGAPSPCPTNAQAQALLSALAGLAALFPLDPPVSASIVAAGNRGVIAYASPSNHHISFVSGSLAVRGGNASAGLGQMANVVGMQRYVAAHEYGHLLQPNTGMVAAVHQAVVASPSSGGLSRYGRSNPVEGYAEAFADYASSGGRSPSAATKAYASGFGWQR